MTTLSAQHNLPAPVTASSAAGDLDAAHAAYEQARQEGRAADFPLPIGMALDGLARVARARGDTQAACQRYEEALTTLRQTAALPREIALMLVALGDLAREEGDSAQARARLSEALDLAGVLGSRATLVATLEAVAVLVLTSAGTRPPRQLEDGVRLFGAVERLRVGHAPATAHHGRAASAHAHGARARWWSRRRAARG
jgi:tetratricopeptide (TPR) repeat protein